jgi:hypothetical protein
VSRTAGAEVDAGQPAAAHLDAALLTHLPSARIPRTRRTATYRAAGSEHPRVCGADPERVPAELSIAGEPATPPYRHARQDRAVPVAT